jgi:hypothetical protein
MLRRWELEVEQSVAQLSNVFPERLCMVTDADKTDGSL